MAGTEVVDRDASSDEPNTAPAGRPGRADVIVWLGPLLTLLAGAVAAWIVSLSAAQALTLLGIPDPGPLTTYGLPAVKAMTEFASVITLGFLFFAAFFVPPQPSGVLDVDGYRASRVALKGAVVWAVGAALMVPLTLSDTSGAPLSDSLNPTNILNSLGRVADANAWFWTAIMAVVIVIFISSSVRWWPQPLIFVWGVLTLMPLVLTGHNAVGGNHDLATNALAYHLIGTAVWVGGLLAVLVYGLRNGKWLQLAVHRFSNVALVLFIVMALSGVINAWTRVPQASDLFTTTYGRLVIAKAVAILALGIFGFLQRKSIIPKLGTADGRPAFVRFAAIEVAIMTVTVGLAVGLGRTPPPPPTHIPTVAEVELGYNVTEPPSVGRVLFDWRFDLIWGTAALIWMGLYAWGVIKLRRRGDAWPIGRTISWMLGCLVLLFATSSGMGRYAAAMFSMHMAGHMLISMVAPVLMVLGGPITLALRVMHPAGHGNPPGMREWIVTLVHSPYARFISRPVIAFIFFVGGFYILYLGGIFGATLDSHAAHVLMNLHLWAGGYLFYWLAIGVDPAPRPLPVPGRLALVFAQVPFHAFFGIALMSMTTVMGAWFYNSLGLDWNTNLLADQKLGGGIAWSAGEIPSMLVIVALMMQWRRSDAKEGARFERNEERDGDAELREYNEQLKALAQRDGRRRP